MLYFFVSFYCYISFWCVLEGVLVTFCTLSLFICFEVGYIFLIASSCWMSFIKLLRFTFSFEICVVKKLVYDFYKALSRTTIGVKSLISNLVIKQSWSFLFHAIMNSIIEASFLIFKFTSVSS